MTIKRIIKNNSDGTVAEERIFDTEAETVTTVIGGGDPTVEPIEPERLAGWRAEEREQAQLDRVDTALADLRAQTRLTVSDYRFDTTTVTDVDVRELARRINALERLNKDLIRLVRGLAAEDEV